MCLVVCAFNQHPDYPLILLANRDEFFARPAAPLHQWDNGIVAGQDLQEGGTWLGIKDRRIAILTNYRDGRDMLNHYEQSRGQIVTDLLTGAANHASNFDAYGGFNALLYDREHGQLRYLSNRGQPLRLQSGVYGLSNHTLDTPWPKVVSLKSTFQAKLTNDEAPSSKWLDILLDTTKAAPEFVPNTYIPAAFEQHLSSIFIPHTEQFGRAYGTRCSTMVAVDRMGGWQIVERSYDQAGKITGLVEMRGDGSLL